MGTDAAELRAEIEDTRADLSRDLDAIGDRVSPRRMMERRTGRMKRWGDNAREAMFGRAHDTRASLSGSAHHAADVARGEVTHAPDMVKDQTVGNPMLTGAVAFGMGFLASMIFAPTEAEERAVGRLEERTGPLAEPVKEMARDVAAELQPAAKEAGQQLKQEASEAASSVKDTAREQGSSVKETARQDAAALRETAKSQRPQR
jgi:gas vesicle protein